MNKTIIRSLKNLCFALAVVLALLPLTPLANAEKIQYYGDVDGSGMVEPADARLILRESVKLENLTGDALILADVDCNGKVESADARLALRMSMRGGGRPNRI